MKNDRIIYLLWLIFGFLLIWVFFFVVFLFDEPKQKKQVQTIPEHKTEIMTHVIRCTTFVNDTCTEYKVYKVVKE